MPESRDDYQKLDTKLSLIKELRARSMTRKDIQDFLSEERKRLGKVPIKCKNPMDYKVDDRTVRRALNSIKKSYGNQLDINKEFGTYKLDLYDFPDTIDETEIQALDVAIQKMGNNKNSKKLLENLKSKLVTRLYHKIERTEPRKAARKINEMDQKINSNYAVVGPRLITGFDEHIKSALDYAICNLREVQFVYCKRKEHTVCPLGIMYGPNNVYLIACKCKNGKSCGKPLHYILSEISKLRETNVQFDMDPEFSLEKYANSMFGIYNDGKIYDIKWLVKDPKTIKIAKRYLFHPSQNLIDNPDGTLTIEMRTGGLFAMSTFLAQWDGKIIPIKPKELVDEYKKLLRNCLDSIKK